VVATFTILADMVANVGGDRVEITTLVGPDSDAHVFSPTPADARAIAASSLVFVNGLGLEGWIDKLIAASGYRGPVVVASAGMQTIAADMSRDARTRHTHGEFDPHGWQSPVQAQRYVSNIADALVSADPSHADAYRARAASYTETLHQLDLQARQKLGTVPAADRRVISGHVSFGYFAQAYGVQFFSPRGMSTESEASAKEVALLSRQIRSERIRAVFVENISDRRLVEQLARESGATIGGVLFSDALSAKDPRARTYVDMMRHNVDEVARALAPPASAATAVN
jgi:zinc/manganese transport system substrate-binding protein